MEFKFDMSKVVKVVTENSDGSLIEYSLKDGVVVDATIVKTNKSIIEEKINELKNNNADVKRISKLIDFNSDNVIKKMAENDNTKVFDVIKDSISNEPIDMNVATVDTDTNKKVEAIANKDFREVMDAPKEVAQFNEDGETIITKKYEDMPTPNLEESAKIMKMGEKMDEYAKKNREMIEKNGIHTQYEISENMHDAMVDEYVLKRNEMNHKMKESNIPSDSSKVIEELDKNGYFDGKMTADEKIQYLKEALKKITDKVNE